jgi:hypothetical protein
LAAIAAGKRVELAAHDAGVSRRTAFEWKAADPTLAAEWDEAYDQATDKLEDVLYNKAAEGDLGALVFSLRSRMPHKYNPALIAKLEMLAIMKAKTEADGAGTPLLIEGQVTGRNGMTISTEFVGIVAMPWNARGPSPHAPGYDLDDDEPVSIVPVEQDGSGKTMNLPRRVICEHHSAPYEHLPVHLVADGETVPPAAATDLWQRIQAHNEWLARAYPAIVDQPRATYPVHRSEIVPPDDEAGHDDDEPPEATDDIDYTGGFGRP